MVTDLAERIRACRGDWWCCWLSSTTEFRGDVPHLDLLTKAKDIVGDLGQAIPTVE